jgi:hypothetical protein
VEAAARALTEGTLAYCCALRQLWKQLFSFLPQDPSLPDSIRLSLSQAGRFANWGIGSTKIHTIDRWCYLQIVAPEFSILPIRFFLTWMLSRLRVVSNEVWAHVWYMYVCVFGKSIITSEFFSLLKV